MLIYRISKMNTPTLKLQSYKPDNQALLARIQELDQLKGELEGTMGRRRQEQQLIRQELERLKNENSKLRREVNQLKKSKDSQSMLIETLQSRVDSAEREVRQYRSQLQAEQQSKRELSQYYQQKVCSILEEKEHLKQSYERELSKISSLSSIPQQIEPPSPSSTSSLSQNSVKSSSSPKKIKRLKRNSEGPATSSPSMQPRASLPLSQKYTAHNVILQKEEDSHLSGEDLYLQMVRRLYKQCQKIELSGKDLKKLPQIQAFSKLRSPTRSELAAVLRSYPLHVGQDRKVDLIHDYMQMQAQRRALSVTGSFIIEEIIKGIQEVEGIYQPHHKNGSPKGRRTSQNSEGYSMGSEDDSYF